MHARHGVAGAICRNGSYRGGQCGDGCACTRAELSWRTVGGSLYSTSIMQEATHSNYLLDGLRTLWGPKAGACWYSIASCRCISMNFRRSSSRFICNESGNHAKAIGDRATRAHTRGKPACACARAPHTDGCWGVVGVIGDLVLMRSFGQLRRDDARPFLAPIQPFLWATNKRRKSYAAAIRAGQQSAVRATRFGPSPRAPSRQRLPSPSRA